MENLRVCVIGSLWVSAYLALNFVGDNLARGPSGIKVSLRHFRWCKSGRGRGWQVSWFVGIATIGDVYSAQIIELGGRQGRIELMRYCCRWVWVGREDGLLRRRRRRESQGNEGCRERISSDVMRITNMEAVAME